MAAAVLSKQSSAEVTICYFYLIITFYIAKDHNSHLAKALLWELTLRWLSAMTLKSFSELLLSERETLFLYIQSAFLVPRCIVVHLRVLKLILLECNCFSRRFGYFCSGASSLLFTALLCFVHMLFLVHCSLHIWSNDYLGEPSRSSCAHWFLNYYFLKFREMFFIVSTVHFVNSAWVKFVFKPKCSVALSQMPC